MITSTYREELSGEHNVSQNPIYPSESNKKNQNTSIKSRQFSTQENAPFNQTPFITSKFLIQRNTNLVFKIIPLNATLHHSRNQLSHLTSVRLRIKNSSRYISEDIVFHIDQFQQDFGSTQASTMTHQNMPRIHPPKHRTSKAKQYIGEVKTERVENAEQNLRQCYVLYCSYLTHQELFSAKTK